VRHAREEAVLPPVLEVYALWHPDDAAGVKVAKCLLDHFRGTTFSGLLGGAVDVFVRSESPEGRSDEAPIAIPALGSPPYGLATPAFTAVVVVVGPELASAVESPGPWRSYVEDLEAGHRGSGGTIGVFPVALDLLSLDGTHLGAVLGGHQQVASGAWATSTFEETLCRDLGQGIAQMVDPAHERVTVFVSHTKRQSVDERGTVVRLVDQVRAAIASSRLGEFFDASDLQPGDDWAPTLIAAASSGALLAVRTDLYSSRPWCQREVLTAKRHEIPVVVLDGLSRGEERGSFLMDHVPRVAGRRSGSQDWGEDAIRSALGQLVDECLKRALWRVQKSIAASALRIGVDWWAAHAPEPTTFADWLASIDRHAKRDEDVVVLHPDPPLGPDEAEVLVQMGRLAGLGGSLLFLTPRGLAAHGA
jgi:hypothetical protein